MSIPGQIPNPKYWGPRIRYRAGTNLPINELVEILPPEAEWTPQIFQNLTISDLYRLLDRKGIPYRPSDSYETLVGRYFATILAPNQGDESNIDDRRSNADSVNEEYVTRLALLDHTDTSLINLATEYYNRDPDSIFETLNYELPYNKLIRFDILRSTLIDYIIIKQLMLGIPYPESELELASKIQDLDIELMDGYNQRSQLVDEYETGIKNNADSDDLTAMLREIVETEELIVTTRSSIYQAILDHYRESRERYDAIAAQDPETLDDSDLDFLIYTRLAPRSQIESLEFALEDIENLSFTYDSILESRPIDLARVGGSRYNHQEILLSHFSIPELRTMLFRLINSQPYYPRNPDIVDVTDEYPVKKGQLIRMIMEQPRIEARIPKVPRRMVNNRDLVKFLITYLDFSDLPDSKPDIEMWYRELTHTMNPNRVFLVDSRGNLVDVPVTDLHEYPSAELIEAIQPYFRVNRSTSRFMLMKLYRFLVNYQNRTKTVLRSKFRHSDPANYGFFENMEPIQSLRDVYDSIPGNQGDRGDQSRITERVKQEMRNRIEVMAPRVETFVPIEDDIDLNEELDYLQLLTRLDELQIPTDRLLEEAELRNRYVNACRKEDCLICFAEGTPCLDCTHCVCSQCIPRIENYQCPACRRDMRGVNFDAVVNASIQTNIRNRDRERIRENEQYAREVAREQGIRIEDMGIPNEQVEQAERIREEDIEEMRRQRQDDLDYFVADDE